MIDSSFLVDVFDSYVCDVRKKFDPVNMVKPEYMYGEPKELNARLTVKSKANRDNKYPLIALILPFERNIEEKLDWYEVSPVVLIVTGTKQEYNAPERYDQKYKPILYPLLNLLETAIKYNANTSPAGRKDVKYRTIDPVNWGQYGIPAGGGLVFADILDCTMVQFTSLKIKKINCNYGKL